MRMPIHLLWLLPLVSGTAWFCTLLLLLCTWLARGRPYYPGQTNPYVAFISDIAAFDLKWPFLAGCAVTSVFFILTISSVHFARYDKRMYGIHDSTSTKLVSIASIVSGVVAGSSLVLLSIMDTYRYHEPHRILLVLYFVGLGLCAICTTFVYFDQTRKPSPFRKLRFYCIFSTAVVMIEAVLGVSFITLMYSRHWVVTGILEWILSFLGAFYILAFVGFVAVPEEGIDIRERDPLLGDRAYTYAVQNDSVRRGRGNLN